MIKRLINGLFADPQLMSYPPNGPETLAKPCGSTLLRRGPRLEGLVSANCHAMSIALSRIIVPQGVVLDTAIVPERDRVWLPLEAAMQLRCLDVPVEHLKYGGALVPLQL